MVNDFEKVADILATHAVRAKTANNPLLSNEALGTGLAGAGLGALLGATSRKNKLRNALTYGLGGGLAGIGAGAMMRGVNEQAAATNAATAQKAQAAAQAATQTAAARKFKSNPTFVDDYMRVFSRWYNPYNTDTSGQDDRARIGENYLKVPGQAAMVTAGGAGSLASFGAAPGLVGSTGLLGGGFYAGSHELADAIQQAARQAAQNKK